MDDSQRDTVAWGRLTVAADQLDDLESMRKATESRLRSLTEPVEIRSAGIIIDKGMAGTPEAHSLEAQLDALKAAEKIAVREIERAMAAHPLSDFVKSTMGVGAKTVARLLGAMGDPLYRFDPEKGEMVERTFSQLKSYCGCGNMAEQRRKKGVKSNWNAKARMRIYNIVEPSIRHRCEACREAGKQRGEGEGWLAPPSDCTCASDGYRYRVIFDEARGHYDSADTTDGHKMNMALQKVKKAFLKDLWLEARRVHSGSDAQTKGDPSHQPEEVTA